MKGELIKIGKSKGLILQENSLWTEAQVKVIAYFVKNNNEPSTYIQIARAYTSSSYSNYQKACLELVKRGYLVKLGKQGKQFFQVSESDWKQAKRGVEIVERPLPYFSKSLKQVKRVK